MNTNNNPNMNTKKLKTQLKEAFEVQGFRYFLNVSNHTVLSYPNNEAWVDSASNAKEWDLVTNDPEHYLEIPKLSKRELYIMMEDFTETVGNKYTQSLLMKALGNRVPFINFQNVVKENDLMKDWLFYKSMRLDEIVHQWLTENTTTNNRVQESL